MAFDGSQLAQSPDKASTLRSPRRNSSIPKRAAYRRIQPERAASVRPVGISISSLKEWLIMTHRRFIGLITAMTPLTRMIAPIALTLMLGTPVFGSPDEWVVTGDGIGPVRFGMKIEEAEQALGMKFETDEYDKDQACRGYGLPGLAGRIWFVGEDGIILVAYVKEGPTATDLGIRIGDSEQRVLDLYKGRVSVEGHKYIEEGHYLNVTGPDGKVQIVFEAAEGKVFLYRAGRERVEDPEMCW
jgi:hypothetical protein